MKEKRLAILKVSWELLRQLLNLPEETDMIGMGDSSAWHIASFVIEHPDLPAVKEGQLVPTVDPQFRRQPEVVFEGWGL